MLAIQPNFTQYSQQPKRVQFKGLDNPEYNDRLYQEKTEFYEHQAQEFNDLIEDETTPKPIKNLMKGFKVISEALLEGWAVAWGASKGARVIKSTVISGANSKLAQNANKALKPMGKRIAQAFRFVATKLSDNVTKLKDSKLASTISTGFTKLAEKLNKSNFGRKIVKGATIVGNAIKTVAKKVLAKLNTLADSVKDMDTGKIYDQTAKASSKVLGIGAGAAGGYNALTNADERVNASSSRLKEDTYDYDNDIFDEYKELEEVEQDIEGEY